MFRCWHNWGYFSRHATGSVFRVCLKCGRVLRWTKKKGWEYWKTVNRVQALRCLEGGE